MKIKSIKSSRSNFIVKALYFISFICIILPLLIIFITEGGVREMLVNSWQYALLLFIIPFATSITGLYHFSFVDDEYIVKIDGKCVALGDWFNKYKKFIELPRDHFLSFYENQSFYGLKKEIYIEFLLHNKPHKQKFNISMLSSRESNLLKVYLNDIVNRKNKLQ